jgi:hypothetical protein
LEGLTNWLVAEPSLSQSLETSTFAGSMRASHFLVCLVNWCEFLISSDCFFNKAINRKAAILKMSSKILWRKVSMPEVHFHCIFTLLFHIPIKHLVSRSNRRVSCQQVLQWTTLCDDDTHSLCPIFFMRQNSSSNKFASLALHTVWAYFLGLSCLHWIHCWT